MLLATVLMVGFIGMISSPSSIFAQEYYDDYETEEYSQYYDEYETEYNNYESYMKDDDPRPIIQKINCDNANYNPPVSINVDLDASNDEASSSSDASRSFSNGDSQSGQRIDRMNANDQKGDFVFTCLNNNNLKVNVDVESTTTNNFNTNNETTVNNLIIERNNAINQEISQSNEACTNSLTALTTAGDNSNQSQSVDATQSNECTVTQSNDAQQDATIEDNSTNNFSGAITSSSIANVEQPQAQTQQHVKLLQDGNEQYVKLLQDGNGVEINKQGNEPIDIRQIKSSQNDNGMEIQQQGNLPTDITQQLESLSINDSPTIAQGIEDSSDLTATEKIEKLQAQYVELYQ